MRGSDNAPLGLARRNPGRPVLAWQIAGEIVVPLFAARPNAG